MTFRSWLAAAKVPFSRKETSVFRYGLRECVYQISLNSQITPSNINPYK